MFRVLLFHMEREINALEATCSRVVCKSHLGWPTTGPFKCSGLGLGLEDVDARRSSVRPAPER